MSNVYWMMTITERSRGKRFRSLYAEYGVESTLTTYGLGTATSEILDSFGLDTSEKSVIGGFVTGETFAAIKKALRKRFQIDVPGTGIVFLIPMSSVGGKRQLKFLLGRQEFEKEEESEMKATEYELIVVVANRGYTDQIMNAARPAGAGGGTVLQAKGTGMQGSEKFFGFVITNEKEMVYLVVRSDKREKIMQAIMEGAGLRTEAQAICFSLPVADVAGLRLADDQEE